MADPAEPRAQYDKGFAERIMEVHDAVDGFMKQENLLPAETLRDKEVAINGLFAIIDGIMLSMDFELRKQMAINLAGAIMFEFMVPPEGGRKTDG